MGILAFLYVKIILLALLVDSKGKGKPTQFSAAAEVAGGWCNAPSNCFGGSTLKLCRGLLFSFSSKDRHKGVGVWI